MFSRMRFFPLVLVFCVVTLTGCGVTEPVRAQPLHEVCHRPDYNFGALNDVQRLDVDNDGRLDFLIGVRASSLSDYDDEGNWLTSYVTMYYVILSCGENVVRQNRGEVYVIEPGEPVDAAKPDPDEWRDVGPLLIVGGSSESNVADTRWGGPLADQPYGYIAFKLRSGEAERYGWMRLAVNKEARPADPLITVESVFVQPPGAPIPIVPDL